MLQKENIFKFGQDQYKALNTLKMKLIEEPTLKLFNPTAVTELHTDASKIGCGAVLMQKDNDNEMLQCSIEVTKQHKRLSCCGGSK